MRDSNPLDQVFTVSWQCFEIDNSFPVACSCHEFTGSTDSCLISGALGNFDIVFMGL